MLLRVFLVDDYLPHPESREDSWSSPLDDMEGVSHISFLGQAIKLKNWWEEEISTIIF